MLFINLTLFCYRFKVDSKSGEVRVAVAANENFALIDRENRDLMRDLQSLTVEARDGGRRHLHRQGHCGSDRPERQCTDHREQRVHRNSQGKCGPAGQTGHYNGREVFLKKLGGENKICQ